MTAHLIHVGYAKTGSNFLRRWFTAHPQIAFVDGGIAGFRNVYDIAAQAAAPAPDIVCRATSAEAIATPHPDVGRRRIDYDRIRRHPMREAQARVCSSLHELFPKATILIVTRGIRSMLLSAYSQYVRTGGELSFEDFFTPGGTDGAAPADAWNYDYLIGLYESAFGSANLILLPYELLCDAPAAFLGEIEERLGLNPGPAAPDLVNAAVSPAALAWYPRLSRLARTLPGQWAIHSYYRRAALAGRLDALAGLLQRLHPLPLPNEAMLSGRELGAFAGLSHRLSVEPLYRPYLGAYLLPDDAAAGPATESAE